MPAVGAWNDILFLLIGQNCTFPLASVSFLILCQFRLFRVETAHFAPALGTRNNILSVWVKEKVSFLLKMINDVFINNVH